MQIWEAAIVKCQKIFILVFAALIDLKTLQKSAFISVSNMSSLYWIILNSTWQVTKPSITFITFFIYMPLRYYIIVLFCVNLIKLVASYICSLLRQSSFIQNLLQIVPHTSRCLDFDELYLSFWYFILYFTENAFIACCLFYTGAWW